MIKNEMRKQSALLEHDYTNYIPVTRKFDKIVPIREIDTNMLSLLSSESGEYISHLKTLFAKHLKIKKNKVNLRGLKRGKIDTFRIWKDDNFMKQTEERIKTDTAVTILVDNSGSMHGEKISNAQVMAYTISKVLKEYNIKLEVLGFTAVPFSGKEMKHVSEIIKDTPKEITNRLQRTHYKLITNVYKSFNDSSFDSLSHIPHMEQNIDNESFVVAAKRLMKRNEPKKIMIILSDGMPMCPTADPALMIKDLYMRIQEVRKLGIEVVAFGLESSFGDKMYPKFIEIGNMENFLKVSTDEFSKLFIGKK